MSKTIRALLKGGDDGRLLQAIFDKIGPCTKRGMPQEHRVVLCIYGAAGHVDCGGVECFLQSNAEDIGEIESSLHSVGLAESADYVRRLTQLFPGGRMPKGPPSPEQTAFLQSSSCTLWMSDVVPELAAWVRAHREAFEGLREDALMKMYAPPRALRAPREDEGTRKMAEWLLHRGAKLRCALGRSKKAPPTFIGSLNPFPKKSFAIVGVEFRHERRDNPQTLETLANWVGQNSIVWLEFDNCRLGSVTLALLAHFPSLRFLSLRGGRFADDELDPLAQAKGLEELNLRGTPISDQGLHALASLPKLKTLDITATRVRGDGLRALRKLNSLCLGGIGDSALSFLGDLSKLTSLDVYGGPLVAKAVKSISKLPGLRDLTLRNTDLQEESLEPLRRNRSLRSLYVEGMKLTEFSARLFADIPYLKKLYISGLKDQGTLAQQLRRLCPSLNISG